MTTKFEKLKAEATKKAKDAEAKAMLKAEEIKSGMTHAANAKADGKSMVS